MPAISVIGAGYWGKNLVRNFFQLPGARLKHVCDRDPAVLARLRGLYPSVEFVADAARVFSDPEVDGVAIATPASSHHAIVREALLAEKHCFVEKPIALEVPHAEELVRLARERRRTLMVGHLLRYHPAIPRIKEILDKGELGRLRYLYSRRLNLGIVRKDENALLSLAPHDVSLQIHLAGAMPAGVVAHGASFLQEGIEDLVFVILRFPLGVLGHIHVSWLDPHKVRSLTLVGSKKMLTFDDTEAVEKIRIHEKSADEAKEYESFGEAISVHSGEVRIPALSMVEPLKIECQHFAECVEKGAEPLTGGEEGIAVLRVLLAAQESLKRGGAEVSV